LSTRKIEERIRPVSLSDAKAYAEMIARSESGWPWSLSGGLRLTARTVREYLRNQACMGRYVAEIDGRLVGASAVSRGLWERNTAYVGFLNVEPDFQGRGIGKRLLRAALDRAIEEGVERVDLDTWAGNLKALPLYKKMGFFWVPETSVFMVNFIPTVLSHPMFKDFFERNPDWYGTQIRDTSPKEDLLERNGLRIYAYRFRSRGEEIEAVFDRNGMWLTGGKNRDMEVWIHPEEERAPDGFPRTVHFELENKTTSEMLINLVVRTPPSTRTLVPPPTLVKIPPGKRAKVRARFVVNPTSERKESWEEPERIETVLIFRGEALTFRTGLGREEALSFEWDPPLLMGEPGTRGPLRLRLRNRTKLVLRGRIEASPLTGLVKVLPESAGFSLDPEGSCGLNWDLEIDKQAPSSHLPIAFSPIFETEEGEIRGRERTFQAECLKTGEMLTYLEPDGKALHVSSGLLHTSIDLRRGGRLEVRDRISGQTLLEGLESDALGPPFWPSEFDRARCDYSLRRESGSVTVTLRMRSEIYAGLTLTKELTFEDGWPLIEVRYGAINDHPKARSFKVKTSARATLNRSKAYLPTRWGIISEETSTGYPRWGDDAPRKPGDYAENWFALEGLKGRLFTVGTIWPRGEGELELGGTGLALPTLNLKVPPRGRATTSAIQIYVSVGDWLGLRETWRRLMRRRASGERRRLPVEVRRPLEFGLSQGPPGPSVGPFRTGIEVSNLRGKQETGCIAMEVPAGWRVRPRRFRFRNLSWRTRRNKILLRPPRDARPGIYLASLVLETEEERRSKDFPIILAGAGKVKIRRGVDEGRDVLRIDNGAMEFRLCPSFGGTIYSLEKDGVEFLRSPFPKERPLVSFNPWFGGLGTPVGERESRGWQETFSAKEVLGDAWEGVETVCTASKRLKEVSGVIFRSKYLVAPSLSLLRIEQVIVNPTTSRVPISSGVTIFPGMGDEGDVRTVVPGAKGLPYCRPRSDTPKEFHSKEGWIGLRNEELDCSLVLTGPVGEGASLLAEEMRGLRMLRGRVQTHLNPGESCTWRWHLALSSADLGQIALHSHIRQLSPMSEPLYAVTK